jgi:hypothetical protein
MSAPLTLRQRNSMLRQRNIWCGAPNKPLRKNGCASLKMDQKFGFYAINLVEMAKQNILFFKI